MNRKKGRKRLFWCAVALIPMLMLAGIFMTFQVFGRYEKIIIQNEDRQLLGLAASVDRSIDSYLYEFSRDLDHVVSQDGLIQTEEGDSLIRYQDENLLMGNPLTWDVVCVKEDTVLYSAQGQTGYRFLEKSRWMKTPGPCPAWMSRRNAIWRS